MTPSPELLKTALMGLFALLVVLAAVRDAVSYTIPNWVSLALAGAFIPAALLLHMPWPAVLATLIVAVVLLVAGMGMFALGWMGGGDAKLLAAASLWIGLPGLAPFLPVDRSWLGRPRPFPARPALGLIFAPSRRLARRGSDAWRPLAAAAPYGVAIAIGALAAFPHGLMMSAAHECSWADRQGLAGVNHERPISDLAARGFGHDRQLQPRHRTGGDVRAYRLRERRCVK